MSKLKDLYDKLSALAGNQVDKPEHLKIKSLSINEAEQKATVKFNPNKETGIGGILYLADAEQEGELVIQVGVRYYYHDPLVESSEVILDRRQYLLSIKSEEDTDAFLDGILAKTLGMTDEIEGLLFSSVDSTIVDEAAMNKISDMDRLNEKTAQSLYKTCVFAFTEKTVTLFIRLIDGTTSHYKLPYHVDNVLIQLFDKFLAFEEYSLPTLFEAYGKKLVARSRQCQYDEVSTTFNEGLSVRAGTYCREYPFRYTFVFFSKFEGRRVEHNFSLDKTPVRSLDTLLAFQDGIDNLIEVSQYEMLRSVYCLSRCLDVANRVYEALDEDLKKYLEMDKPHLDWKEPSLSNYPRIVIPVSDEQHFVANEVSEKEVWFVLEDAKGNKLYGLDFWVPDDATDQAIREVFARRRPYIDVESLKMLSKCLDVPITLNGVRLGKVTTSSSTLDRVLKIFIESLPLMAKANLTVVDKETTQRLTMTTDLPGNLTGKVESFAKYANNLFKDFELFS